MLKLTNTEFIKRAKQNFPEYDYSKTNYLGMNDYVCVICPIHGEFEKFASELVRKKNPRGCQLCAKEKSINKQTKSYNTWLTEAKQIHKNPDGTPKYDYSITEKTYRNSLSLVDIICPIHGKFSQRASNHLLGRGCPKCGSLQTSIKQQMSFDEFVSRAQQIHKNPDSTPKYIYHEINLANEVIPIECPKHGIFYQTPHNHLEGRGCRKCNYGYSQQQTEFNDFIKSIISEEILFDNRKIINPLELDIYIPSKKIGIEYNGLYWHSELFKSKNYHLQKTVECENKGIQLIHVFEDEWINKKEIVKSRLRQIFGLNKYKIFARNCEIRTLSTQEEKIFFDNQHLQGYIVSTICYGLIYTFDNKEYIVSAMSFGPLRTNLGSKQENSVYEMYRFACLKNFSVIGGASKLFKHFIKRFNPNKIISYADRRWSTGNLYKQLGFVFSKYTEPSYFYVDGNKRINRFSLRKNLLISKHGCPEDISEHDFCLTKQLFRIYDVGNLKFEYNKTI